MAQSIVTFDTEHSGTIHDSQLDYYGKRLATASSDHTVRIWDVSSETPQWLAELKGHEGPVWQVCWAHPKYGSMLVSCSYDKRAIVWREERAGEWQQIYRHEDHTGSVNGVAFAPWEFGLHFAAASSDGSVSIHSHMPDNNWSRKTFQAHANGVTAVSWMPATSAAALSSAPASQHTPTPRQIVTGGCDNQVRIWLLNEASGDWNEAHQMADGHTDWVRDVAWRPNVGAPTNVIASGSEDGTVIIWTQNTENTAWKNSCVLKFNAPVWRVSWSITGTVLAVACGNSNVSLYKETLDGSWEMVTNMMDASDPPTPEQAKGTEGPTDPFRREGNTVEQPQQGEGSFDVNLEHKRDLGGFAATGDAHQQPTTNTAATMHGALETQAQVLQSHMTPSPVGQPPLYQPHAIAQGAQQPMRH